MALHWFISPVYVAIDEGRDRYAVTNVERAAEFLLSWRHHGQGERWRLAVQASMAAIKNQIPVEDARSAFEAAVIECGQVGRYLPRGTVSPSQRAQALVRPAGEILAGL
ncbi:MAG TPA: DUF982 domain-containing protein [Bosea sp. (in: a-proteobacteria)]|jgi:hypothetical protein|uniref:DUF982 domain-containing protein n=1 Tax=Bosea sp. (in: a-proteobacteria) TaxID=1871050 RepID=UPI002DDCBEE5|nr:DUF982 domain-containing protein [Bosea sp. (in: a-proteobacteria)]HEV2554946.1 DUF982 domain-containing protein [Bosea sp. (in: a-proteobacteria)]